MATENTSSGEGASSKDSLTVRVPESDGAARLGKLIRRAGEKAAGIKNSLPWADRTKFVEATSGQQIAEDSGSDVTSEQDKNQFADLEDKLVEAGVVAERELKELEGASAIAHESGTENALLLQKENELQARQRQRKEKTEIRERRRLRLRKVARTTAIVSTLLGSAATFGIRGVPAPYQALATAIAQGHPSHTEELENFYPEIAKDNHEIVPIDANTTIFNFTDQEVNLEGIRETFAFLNQLANLDKPIFLEQSGKSFTVHYENYGSFDFQASFGQREARNRAFILAPAKDHAITSEFVKERYGDTTQTADSYTAINAIGTERVPVTVSYIYQPDPHNNPNGTSFLLRFNTEACQAFLQASAPSDVKFPSPDKQNPNIYVQEGICGILAQALGDVQNGMSRQEFIKKYASPNAPPFMDVSAPMIPLQPWLYDLMKDIKPAVR